MPKSRKLLVVTDKRRDGQALSPYQQTIFNNVLEHAEKVCGRWDDVEIVGSSNARATMREFPKHDVLLIGSTHAEEIHRISKLNTEKLIEFQLCGLLCEWQGRRVIATHPISAYGAGDKAKPVRASLLGRLYRHLEMLAIGLPGWENPGAPSKYRLVRSMDDWHELRQLLEQAPVVAIDTETTTLQRIKNTILTIQFGFDGKTGWVLPIAHPETPFEASDIRIIRKFLRNYFERSKRAIHVYANAAFDLHQLIDFCDLRWYNHRIWDVQAGAFNLDENRQALKMIGANRGDIWGLERLCFEFGMDHYTRTKLGKSDRSRLESKPLEDVAEYGGVDVVVPIRLMRMQQALAAWRSDQMPGRPYDRFRKHVMEVEGIKIQQFVFMERSGLKVDVDYMLSLSGTSGVFLKEIRESEKRFNAVPAVVKANKILLGNNNVRSGSLFGGSSTQAWVFDAGKQAHKEALFDKVLQLKPVSTGKNDAPKYDKYFKEKYKGNAAVDAFDDLVEAKTLYGTFIKGFYKILRGSPDNRDGRLHTIFSYLNVKTGRSSSIKPNLQNLPERKKRAKIIKRQIICEDCNLIFKRDYSAHEIRVWGISSRDKAIALAFWTGMKVRLAYQAIRTIADDQVKEWETKLKAADVHRQNYGMLYHVDPATVGKPERDGVKTTIFGSLYGYGMKTLGRVLTKHIPKRIKEIDAELITIDTQIHEYKKERRLAA